MISHFNHWWVKLLLLAAGAILFFAFVPMSCSCSGTSDSKIEIKTIKVQLDCCRWSDWIRLPPGTKFRVDAPGWHECYFWDGSRKKVENKNCDWMGDIPSSVFKLRGEKGEAIITYEICK